MLTPTTKGRALAIVVGAAFLAGGLTILLGEKLLHPLEWTSFQWLVILTVFGTIGAGHLMSDAARAAHVFSTIGFFVLFMSGTGLVVYSSVGNQVEKEGVVTLSVDDTNTRIQEKRTDLAAAKQRKSYAEAQVQKTMTGSFCGRGCTDWKQNAADVGVVVDRLEADIAALGPKKPAGNVQAAAMADLAALFGFSKPQTVAALTLALPFLKTLFFEIGSIVSLGFAFRPGPIPVVKSSRTVDRSAQTLVTPTLSVAGSDRDVSGQSDYPADNAERFAEVRAALLGPVPNGPTAQILAFEVPNGSPNGPKGPKPRKRARIAKEQALADLSAGIERGERFGSQVELAGRYGVATSTMSDWLGDWERSERIPARTTVGRCKAVSG